MLDCLTFFWDGPFSQWYPSTFSVEDVKYDCDEQYMMAEKARFFGDDAAADAIMAACDPREQKQMGREIRAFDSDEWEHLESNGRPYCWNVVRRGNLAKFTQNHDLQRKLLATEGTTLVEASPVDSIWGIGLAEDDPRAIDRSQWLGRNWLGEVLTDVRDHLIATK